MSDHEKTESHMDSQVRMTTWTQVQSGAQQAVDCMQNSRAMEQLQKNRAALQSIVKTLILCGRQGIALRGHRDDGALFTNESSNENQGNFRALLQARIDAGDVGLVNHFKFCSSRATYISKTCQNELLCCIEESILSDIVTEINSQPGPGLMFSVCADEVTDNNTQSQLGVPIRYVDSSYAIQDRFIGFIKLDSLSGATIANELVKVVRDAGLDPSCTVGLGFDGAANMSGLSSSLSSPHFVLCINRPKQHITDITHQHQL